MVTTLVSACAALSYAGYARLTGSQPVTSQLYVAIASVVAVAGFARAARVAARAFRDVLGPWLILTLAGLTGYGFNVLGSVTLSAVWYSRVAEGTWFCTPLTVAAWLETTRATRARANGNDRTGRPSVAIRVWARVAIWGPAVGFAIAGLKRGVMTSPEMVWVSSWQGFALRPRWPYLSMAVWVMGALVWSSWQLRPSALAGIGLRSSTRLRMRCLAPLAWTLTVFASLLFLAGGLGWWSESIIDVFLAPIILSLTVLLVASDCESTSWSALRLFRMEWRFAAATMVVIPTFALLTGHTMFGAGILAVIISVLVPLPNHQSTESKLRDGHDPADSRTDDTTTLPSDAVARYRGLVGADLLTILKIGRNTTTGSATPVITRRLRTFIDATYQDGTAESLAERLQAVARRALRDALDLRSMATLPRGDHPNEYELLAAYIIAGWGGLAGAGKRDRAQRSLEERLLLCYQIWKLGGLLEGGPYYWSQLWELTIEELRRINDLPLHQPNPKIRAKLEPSDAADRSSRRKRFQDRMIRATDGLVVYWASQASAEIRRA